MFKSKSQIFFLYSVKWINWKYDSFLELRRITVDILLLQHSFSHRSTDVKNRKASTGNPLLLQNWATRGAACGQTLPVGAHWRGLSGQPSRGVTRAGGSPGVVESMNNAEKVSVFEAPWHAGTAFLSRNGSPLRRALTLGKTLKISSSG